MAKKRRTAKQRAATRKMIAANRKGKRRSKRRNPIASAAERKKPKRKKARKSAKRVAAGKKAARTRAAHKAKRRAAARRGRRKGSKAFKRSAQGRTARKRAAARYRKAGYAGPYAPDASERKRRRRRRNPIAKAAAPVAERKRRRSSKRRRNPISSVAAAPHRKRRKGRKSSFRRRDGKFKRTSRKRHYVKSHARKGGKQVRRHMRNPLLEGRPIANPITGPMEFLGGVLGVGVGFGLASLGDRLATTHALNAANQDAPAAGQIYNSEALDTPLWSSFSTVGYKRFIAAGLTILVPLGAASAVKKHLGLKSFFQLMAFGALGRTAGKLVDDGVAQMMAKKPLAQRLYGGEIAAQAKLAAATTTALPAAVPATFAGLPNGSPITRQLPRQTSAALPPPPPARHIGVSPAPAAVPSALGAQPFPASTSFSFPTTTANPDGRE